MHSRLVTYKSSIATRISMYKNGISLRSKSRIYNGLKLNTKYKRDKLSTIEIETTFSN
ncbi:hypothetical protein Hanom_Chr07g00621701 [Helianthus anomalus]